MKIITQNDIKEINRLYLELKTYAAVSRATGFSLATVKKYIMKDFKIVDEKNVKRFEGELPEFDNLLFRKSANWGKLCELTDEEVEEITYLWEELEV